MPAKITAKEGWVDVEIDGNCAYTKFEEVASLLKKQYKVKFIEKLNHLDDAYWDFIYKDCELTLHFNHYFGVSLFPKKFGEATTEENRVAKEIGTQLFEILNHSS